MIRPEDVKIERREGFLPGTLELVATLGRSWGHALGGPLRSRPTLAAEVDVIRRGEERLRAAVMHDIYGGIAAPLRVVEMALRILGPLSGPPGFLAPEPLAEALAQLRAYADAGNYTLPDSTAAPRLPQDMETDAE